MANFNSEETRTNYRRWVREFVSFISHDDFTQVKTPHVWAWREYLKQSNEALSIRAKLTALSSLFTFLGHQKKVEENPVSTIERPKTDSNRTPVISNEQMIALLDAPDPNQHQAHSRKLKAVRDRAILSVFAYSAMRCSELARLRVRDIIEHKGVKEFRVHGKGDKKHHVYCHPDSLQKIHDYLNMRGSP